MKNWVVKLMAQAGFLALGFAIFTGSCLVCLRIGYLKGFRKGLFNAQCVLADIKEVRAFRALRMYENNSDVIVVTDDNYWALFKALGGTQ